MTGVPKPAPPPSAARAKIIYRYARISPKTGKPMRCGLPGTNRKVIFDTAQDASDAETALRETGSKPQRIYACERSQTGHYHLTGDLAGRPTR